MVEERSIDLPFPFDSVWDAARKVIEESQWKIRKADRTAGQYEVLVNIPMDDHSLPIPFTEKLRAEIVRIDEKSTRVYASIRFHEWHWGTTRWHLNSFLKDLKAQLERGR